MKTNRTAETTKLMLDNYRRIMPDIPDSFWDEIDLAEFEDLIIPIYTKHLTTEDMNAIIEFYDSPAGQKILDKTPAIMKESMKAGKQWGRELAHRWEEKHDLERT